MDRSVVFLDLKGGCAPCDKPLMLRPILFCPVLTWVAQELTVCGAQRFFIVCDEAWQDEVREVMEGFDTRLFASAQEAPWGRCTARRTAAAYTPPRWGP